MVKKGYYANESLGLAWDRIKLSQMPLFSTTYVDDTVTKNKKNTTVDELFENIYSHHRNIKLAVENNRRKKVFQKLGEFSVFWNS